MRRESVAEHVRADPIGRNARVRRHLPNDLEQPNATEMRFAAGEQPRRPARHMLEPRPNRAFRTRRDRDQPFLAALAPDDQERLALAHCAAREANQLARSKARSVEQLEQREIAHGGELAARSTVLSGFEHA